MFIGFSLLNLKGIISISIVDIGVAFIETVEGVITVKSISPDIEYIISIISKKVNDIYVITKHYDRDEHFIDIITIEGRL